MSLSSTVLLGLAAVTAMLLGKRPRAPGKPDLRQRIRGAKNEGELDRLHREVLRLRSTDHKADTSPLFDAILLKRSQIKNK